MLPLKCQILVFMYMQDLADTLIFSIFFLKKNFFSTFLKRNSHENQSILSSSLPSSLAPFSSTAVGRESKDGFSSVCPFVKIPWFIQSCKYESNSSWDPYLSTSYQLAKAFIPKCFNAYDLNSYLGGTMRILTLAFWIHTLRNKNSLSSESS